MTDIPPHLNRMTMFCQSRSEIMVQVNMSVSLGPPDLLYLSLSKAVKQMFSGHIRPGLRF